MELTVTQPAESAASVVSVAGEVDVHSAPQLREGVTAQLATDSGAVVVDLSQVAFLDSTGLGALVSARSAAGERGVALPIVCTSARILKLFTITGLDGVFDIHDSVDSALASVAEPA
ncbi:MAG: STAS domain-containing protein [Jatrophihabitantaceae bacterium]